jgi:amino acid adenylation domain-containing protein
LAHQELPLEQLVEVLQPERDASHTPLVQVVFSLRDTPLEVRQLGPLRMQPAEIHNGTAKYDLVVEVSPTETGLEGTIEYSTELFDADTIERLVGHLTTVWTAAAEAPDVPLAELPLLTSAERRQVLVEWNATATQPPIARDQCVHELVERRAKAAPEALAVTGPGSGGEPDVRLSYGELDRRATELARYLQRLGVGPEVVVGVHLDRTPELVVALLGVWKAGGAYLPLEPGCPPDRMAFMLADARARVLLTRSRLLTTNRLFAGEPDPLTAIRAFAVSVSATNAAADDIPGPRQTPTPANLAYVIYTSGSTGQPKGVQIDHASLLNLIDWHQAAFDVSARDRATLIAGLAFDASVWELWPYLTAGASIHMPDEATRTTPLQLRDWLVARGITLGFVPTPLAEALLGLDWQPDRAPRLLLTGGDRLHAAPQPEIPFRLINNYGPTECTVVSTSGLIPPADGAATPSIAGALPGRAPSLGKPIANFQTYVLGPRLEPLPVGIPGELYIGGAGLARGFLGRPDLTAERFIPDPFGHEPGRRLYRTGDRVQWRADGELEFLGRVDRQVKLRGFRIELGEIEAALARVQGISEVAVLVREDVAGQRLVAYVVPAPGYPLDTEALRRELARTLPDYMVPTAFVTLASLPLTANGKVDRQSLPAPAEAAQEHRPPATETERVVAGIWASVLGLEAVSREAGFFDLGGNSLAGMQVVTRVRDAFGINLSAASIFEYPTLAAFAAAVEAAHGNGQHGRGTPAIRSIRRAAQRGDGGVETTRKPVPVHPKLQRFAR